jgi:hypothetical protein
MNDLVYSQSTTVLSNTTFTVGYITVWDEKNDIQTAPTSNSVKRNVNTGFTYGGARTSNVLYGINSLGWIDFEAQFSSTQTTGSVYLVFSNTLSTTNFDPAQSGYYIEYRKTGTSSAAVYVKNGTTLIGPISGLTISSRLRIERVSYTAFDKNGLAYTAYRIDLFPSNSKSRITLTPTITYSGIMRAAVFSSNIGDGLTNVLTSFPCSYDNQYYYLNDEIVDNYAYITDSELRFKFEEDYFDASGVLNYKIKNISSNNPDPNTYIINKPNHTNWIKISLGSPGGLGLTSGGNLYLLEVSDVNGRKKYLKFKYQM